MGLGAPSGARSDPDAALVCAVLRHLRLDLCGGAPQHLVDEGCARMTAARANRVLTRTTQLYATATMRSASMRLSAFSSNRPARTLLLSLDGLGSLHA